jgi:hypothetical protein
MSKCIVPWIKFQLPCRIFGDLTDFLTTISESLSFSELQEILSGLYYCMKTKGSLMDAL